MAMGVEPCCGPGTAPVEASGSRGLQWLQWLQAIRPELLVCCADCSGVQLSSSLRGAAPSPGAARDDVSALLNVQDESAVILLQQPFPRERGAGRRGC